MYHTIFPFIIQNLLNFYVTTCISLLFSFVWSFLHHKIFRLFSFSFCADFWISIFLYFVVQFLLVLFICCLDYIKVSMTVASMLQEMEIVIGDIWENFALIGECAAIGREENEVIKSLLFYSSPLNIKQIKTT